MSQIQTKIENIKDRMLGLDQNSMEYIAYSDTIRELTKMLPPTPSPVIVVHKAEEPEICESCQ